MEVQIYREPENENLILDENARKEYNELATELGLAKMNATVGKCPSVYLPLNSYQSKSLQVLCPQITEVKEYTNSTIPLEVLKVYKFAVEQEMFEGYQIWHNYDSPDPLLIGWNYESDSARENTYSWQKNRFLMARWGAEALPQKELFAHAKKVLSDIISDKAQAVLNTAKNYKESPEIYAEKVLQGTSIMGNLKLDLPTDSTIY